jgi:hypothetical protein
VADGGYSPTAEALRHAAEIVRLTGHATPVTLTIDGVTRNFLAVAEQLDFPNLQCNWPSDTSVVQPPDSGIVLPPDSNAVPPIGIGLQPLDSVVPPDSGGTGGGGGTGECTVVGTYSMRTLIAWEPDSMAEVIRIVADTGSNVVQTGVPDVMIGLPTSTVDSSTGPKPPGPVPDDSGGGGGTGSYPGFLGEYLVRDVGSWWAVEGTEANTLLETGGACTADGATFDWAEFACEAARFEFEFSMRVEALRIDPLVGRMPRGALRPNGAEESHTLGLTASAVDGVRLTVVAWTAPPEPLPVDSVVAQR